MNKIKNEFIKDFENSSKEVNLSFDVTKLEKNTRKTRHKMRARQKFGIIFSTVLTSAIVIISIPIAAAIFETKNNVREYSKKYALNEIKIAESNTFKKLNNVNYPNNSSPVKTSITQKENEAYSNFINQTYQSLIKTSYKDNISYSAIGLYTVMSQLKEACSSSELASQFDSLLGLNKVELISFYNKLMKANSFASNDITTQLKNAAFYNCSAPYNSSYVDYLTSLYTEAYTIDFATETNKIIEWVDDAMNSKKFIDNNFLNIEEDSALYLLSTLYFNHAWENKYLNSNNVTRDFHLRNGQSVSAKFMRHTYIVESYYDYDSYISFSDYYKSKNASITYIVPKNTEDDILELTKGKNIFVDDPSALKWDEYNRRYIIDLTTPKFKSKVDVDFKNSLSSIGFNDMFNKNLNTLGNAFEESMNASELVTGLNELKQRNEITFSEDGTIIKSVTVGGLFKGTAPAPIQTIEIKLDRPFIYIIKDSNNIPIFVGHMDNPKV